MGKHTVYSVKEGVVKNKNLVLRIFLPTLIVALGLVGLFKLAPASAATINWSGHNGTDANGYCSNVSSDSNVTGQNWQFILTSPDGTGPYTLTAQFNPATTPSPIVVTGTGGGAIHFIVNTAIGAQLLSASATGGSSNSNLTVSDCTVGKYSPTISTIPSAGGTIGTVLNDTANLAGGNNPTGNVIFKLFAPSDSTCSLTPVYTYTDAAAPYATTPGFTSNAVGTWHWTAHYAGDTNNNSADSLCAAETVTTTKASPGINTTASGGGVIGTQINDSASVTGGYSPTGNVTFYLFGPGDNCNNINTALFTETDAVSSGSAGPTGNYTTAAVGTYHWEAVYNGDGNNNTVTSNCTDEAVTTTKASPDISTTPSTGGVVGVTLNDSASVTGGYSPTGSVTFKLFAPSDPTCSATAVYTDTEPTAPYATSPGFASNAVGVWHWTAHYAGDTNNNSADSLCAAETVTTTQATPSISTTASDGGVIGVNIHDTASVTGGYNPTGNVTFYLFAPGDNCSNVATAVYTETDAVSSGSAGPTANFATNKVGTYHWEAVYNGDSNNVSVSSVCTSEPVTITKASPGINTTASGGGVVGVQINDRATVSGGYVPSGTVTFYLFGPNDNCSNVNTALFTETDPLLLSLAGPTGNYTTAAVGTYHWQAVYSGDDNNDGVTSSCSDEAVTTIKASPGINTTASVGGVVGIGIHDLANVTGGNNPTGTVTFYLFAPGDNCSVNTTNVFSQTKSLIAGVAGPTDNYTTTAVGIYHWKAIYNGDGLNNGVTSNCSEEAVTITKASPSISTVPSAGGPIGVVLNDSATVTGGVNPTGSVTFKLFSPSDTTCSGAPVFTNTDLTAPYATSTGFTSNAAGTWHWTAHYAGDANNNPADSACSSEAVTVTAVLYWCSPGFWANGAKFDVAAYVVAHGKVGPYSTFSLSNKYSTIPSSLHPAAPSKKAPIADPTLAQVLANPNTYGGPAFNSVADYIGYLLGWSGNQNTGENCPLNAHGVLTTTALTV